MAIAFESDDAALVTLSLRRERTSDELTEEHPDSIVPLRPRDARPGDWWRLPNGDIAICAGRSRRDG